jgi:hypothetical protein
MKEWTIKVFKKENGEDVFEEWMAEQDIEAQEKIRARLDMMSIARTNTWGRPYVGNLKNHIHELIIECKNKQYRPLICFGMGHVFILLVGATKKGGRKRGSTIWTPPDAIEIAKKRRELIIKDGRCIGEYRPREKGSQKKPKQ